MNDLLLEKFNKVEKTHWWWEGRRALVKLLLENTKPKKILDVGCGTGETMTYLSSLYPKAQLYGVDNLKKAVSFSKSRGHKKVFLSEATKLPFKNNIFDIVLFLDVLEHIKDHQKAVAEAKRVLKKGGKIIITSPGLSFIWTKFDEKQGHQRRYTRREIVVLAKNVGMKVELVSYFNFFLSLPIIFIRLISKIKGFGFLTDYDRSFNYDIAFKTLPNKILGTIFTFEVNKIRSIKYPIGISVAAVFSKK